MSVGRLSKKQKEELVESYRRGQTTSAIAKAYGCSPNTVNRTVKTSLLPEEYEALKTSRIKGKGGLSASNENISESKTLEVSSFASEENYDITQSSEIAAEVNRSLALNDADDFKDDSEEGQVEDAEPTEIFHEVVPLNTVFEEVNDRDQVSCEQLMPGLLPVSLYMLVDKTVELDARPLRDFPELGTLQEEDKELKALSLFSNPRAARRQCGRNQRVIKIPDSQVFQLSTPYLLARGITRLVLEGALIALDS